MGPSTKSRRRIASAGSEAQVNGIDLTNSVENEFYCLKLLELFGLPVNKAEIMSFGDIKRLFDLIDHRFLAEKAAPDVVKRIALDMLARAG